MGDVVSHERLSQSEIDSISQLCLLCFNCRDLYSSAFSMNLPLAIMLEKINPRRREMRIESCLSEILNVLPDNTIIKEFDVLFNPNYRIDVLKLLISVHKRKPLKAFWPGTFSCNKLIYAEEGMADYKTYNLDDYPITIMI